MLEPGDLILVRSRGAMSTVGRWLGKSPHDHIAVVVDDGRTVNIDKPATRLLPVARLVRPELAPVVLRPVWHDAAARAGFVRWMESLVGAKYDVRRTLRLVPSLLLRRIGVISPLRRAAPDADRWICTDAVVLGLERFARGFPFDDPALDWTSLGCATTNDFLRVADRRPDLLARVPEVGSV